MPDYMNISSSLCNYLNYQKILFGEANLLLIWPFQSLLRGRFLRTERPVEDERPASVAAGELLQLRQRHTVSGLRCDNFFAY